MSSKAFLFVAIFLVFQGFGNAEDIPEEVDETITDIVNKNEGQIKAVEDQLETCIRDRLLRESIIVAYTLKSHQAKIEGLLSNAQVGSKYYDCVKENEQSFSKLKKDIIENVRVCISDKVKTITELIQAKHDKITGLKALRKAAYKEYRICADTDCKRNVVKNLLSNYGGELFNIALDIKSIVKQINEIPAALKACSIPSITQITEDANKIVEAAQQCPKE